MEGNNKAMRDALNALNSINTIGLKRVLVELVEADIFDGGLINKTISAVEMAKRALAAPPRQCDLGTAEEQADRYEAFCAKHFAEGDNPCGSCPLSSQANLCKFAWAQMPYEANEKGEVDDSNG